MTLRRQLVAILVGLVAIGLAAFGVISYRLYSNSAYGRIDGQLQSAEPLLSVVLRDPAFARVRSSGNVGRPPRGSPNNLPEGSYAVLLTAGGEQVNPFQVPCYPGRRCPLPKLPAGLRSGTSRSGRFLSVGAVDGSTSFRVLVRPAAYDPGLATDTAVAGDEVVTAIPLTETIRSLHHLILLDVSVGAGVLVALSVGGLLVLRRGLHPLERMAATARSIAAGDLSQRAAPADGRTEVGQLGLAFNTMVDRIEQAFAARDRTEARLREFLADASHELRTPLTSIRGYAELYRMGAAGDRAEADMLMSRIEENALQMGGLVEELLLLAHLDETRPPERLPVDLVVLVADACDDAAVTAPDRRLRLDAAQSVSVIGDAKHLRQAVANLLTNAVRHTPPGSPIDVSVAAAGGAAVVRVRDHGPGLPAEGLEHAFDRFWRADRSRARSGNGLGLAIVAAVSAEHGGVARVANVDDGGAVFELRLPMMTGHG